MSRRSLVRSDHVAPIRNAFNRFAGRSHACVWVLCFDADHFCVEFLFSLCVCVQSERFISWLHSNRRCESAPLQIHSPAVATSIRVLLLPLLVIYSFILFLSLSRCCTVNFFVHRFFVCTRAHFNMPFQVNQTVEFICCNYTCTTTGTSIHDDDLMTNYITIFFLLLITALHIRAFYYSKLFRFVFSFLFLRSRYCKICSMIDSHARFFCGWPMGLSTHTNTHAR